MENIEPGSIFSCVVEHHDAWNHTQDVKIDLVTVPRVTKFEALETEVIEGSKIAFTCNAFSTPKVSGYKLYLGNRLLSETSSGEFEINVDRSFNDQDLFCEAENLEAGSGRRFKLTTPISVKFAPTLVNKSGLTNSEKNAETSLFCEFSGLPKPKITWFFTPRNTQEPKILATGQSLKLTNTTEKDTGIYTCQAENHVGHGISTAVVELQVVGRPRIVSINLDHRARTLTCNALSVSSVNISMSCKQGPLAKVGENVFLLDQWFSNDNCECKAENNMGDDISYWTPDYTQISAISQDVSSFTIAIWSILIVALIVTSAFFAILCIKITKKRRANDRLRTFYTPEKASIDARQSGPICSNSNCSNESLFRKPSESSGGFGDDKISPDSSSGISSYVILDGSEQNNTSLIVKKFPEENEDEKNCLILDPQRIQQRSHTSGCVSDESEKIYTALKSPRKALSFHNHKESPNYLQADSSNVLCHDEIYSLGGNLVAEDLYSPEKLRHVANIVTQHNCGSIKPARRIKSITHV